MTRIAILGNAGAGKSYLAERLAAALALPVIDLDDLFWMPPGQYESKRPAKQLVALVAATRLAPEWIVEGVYGELVTPFLERAELLIWLDMPWEISLARLERRRRPSVANEEPQPQQETLQALLTYAAAYWTRDDSISHAGHRRTFDAFVGPKEWLTSEDDVNAFLVRALGQPE